MTKRAVFLEKKAAKAAVILEEIKQKLAGFKGKNFFQKVATIGDLIAFIIGKIDSFNAEMDNEEATLLEDKTDVVLDRLNKKGMPDAL
jgi:hypothetical protein